MLSSSRFRASAVIELPGLGRPPPRASRWPRPRRGPRCGRRRPSPRAPRRPPRVQVLLEVLDLVEKRLLHLAGAERPFVVVWSTRVLCVHASRRTHVTSVPPSAAARRPAAAPDSGACPPAAAEPTRRAPGPRPDHHAADEPLVRAEVRVDLPVERPLESALDLLPERLVGLPRQGDRRVHAPRRARRAGHGRPPRSSGSRRWRRFSRTTSRNRTKFSGYGAEAPRATPPSCRGDRLEASPGSASGPARTLPARRSRPGSARIRPLPLSHRQLEERACVGLDDRRAAQRLSGSTGSPRPGGGRPRRPAARSAGARRPRSTDRPRPAAPPTPGARARAPSLCACARPAWPAPCAPRRGSPREASRRPRAPRPGCSSPPSALRPAALWRSSRRRASSRSSAASSISSSIFRCAPRGPSRWPETPSRPGRRA